MSKLGKMLKKFRLENELTQQEVGNKIGYTKQFISSVEKGETIIKKIDTALKFVGKVRGVTKSEVINNYMRDNR